MSARTVIAVACLSILAVAAEPGVAFAQTSKQPTATAPGTGGPNDTLVNSSHSNIRHPGLAYQPSDQTTAVPAAKTAGAGGPNDAAINTTRSNIKHPSLATQPTGGTTGTPPQPKPPTVMDEIATTR